MNVEPPSMRLAHALDRLDRISYPATSDEVLSGLDADVIEHPNGPEKPDEVFDRVAVERFTCPDDACLALLSAVGAEAVGRRRYSDRDPPASPSEYPQPLSL